MKILKAFFAFFLLLVLGMAMVIPAQAKNNPKRAYGFQYHVPKIFHYKKTKEIKPVKNQKSFKIPTISQYLK